MGCRAGATALDAALHADIVHLSWRFLPVVVVSSLIMLIWALIINNLGRRRYPLYWWSPDRCFVRPSIENDVQGASEDKASEPDGRIDRAEDGRTRKISGLGERQRIEGKEDQGEERETGDEQRLGSDVMTELGKRV